MAEASNLPTSTLTMVHHFDVSEALKDIPRSELLRLGGALGLFYPKLSKMEDLLPEMVAAWLNREDGVLERTGEPSWTVLVDTLRKIGQSGVADSIIKKYKVSTPRPTPVDVRNGRTNRPGSDNPHATLDSKPLLHELDLLVGNGMKVRVFSTTASRWDNLALRLYFEPSDIERIRKNNHFMCESACRSFFGEWLQGKGRQPITWRTLVTALVEVDLSEFAKEIEQALGEA